MRDRRLRSEAGVRASQALGDAGVPLGEPLDVDFVDDGVLPACLRRTIALPRKPVIDDHALGRAPGAVAMAHDEIVVVCPDRSPLALHLDVGRRFALALALRGGRSSARGLAPA